MPRLSLARGILGVLTPHVVALLVGHHLERQLVVIAQEDAPLAVGGQRGGAIQDLGDRISLFAAQTHEHPRHQGKVEAHVALGPLGRAEIIDNVLGPLIRLRKEHLARVLGIDRGAQVRQEGVRLGQVLAVGSLSLEEVRHGVKPEAIHTEVEPEPADVDDLRADARVVVVEIRLMAEEAVKVVGARDVVPCPVRRLGVDKDDPRFGESILCRRPHVPVAMLAVG